VEETEYTMTREKILIIEDTQDIGEIIKVNLEDSNFKAHHVSRGIPGLNEAKSGDYSLIILDLMLPDIDGLTICRKIREDDKKTPILILTAKGDEIDRVLGLEIGADDYMTKPFSTRELVARVKAILRRVNLQETDSIKENKSKIISIGNFKAELSNRAIYLKDTEIQLTVKEFELLSLFLQNPGRTFSRTDLLEMVWGFNFDGYEHTVNTHINRLRNKIESDPGNPEYLKTVWGIGYRFNV